MESDHRIESNSYNQQIGVNWELKTPAGPVGETFRVDELPVTFSVARE